MNILVKPYELPKLEFNYEELKSLIVEKVSSYEGLVYTDAKTAKEDRAYFNKVKKELNDKRISLQKEYMMPFEGVKKYFDELISIVDKGVSAIDIQVKEYEAKQKSEKQEQINSLFEATEHPGWLKLEQIQDAKWLNATKTIESVKEEMELTIQMIVNQYSSLDGLDYEFEIKDYFQRTLSLNGALEEMKCLKEQEAKRHAVNAQKPQTETFDEEAREWMTLKIKLNTSDFDAFEKWAEGRNIEWQME